MHNQFLTNDGYQYFTDIFGIIHQCNPDIINYDTEYVSTYQTPEYVNKSAQLMGIRLGSLLSLFSSEFDRMPSTLLDVGYGDGSFLNAAKNIIPTCFGLDVSNVEPPAGCRRLHDYRYTVDIITFWDAFEHIPDIDFIEDVSAKMICMSMPNLNGWNFETWKHRKPNEHLHHFTPKSLQQFMSSKGWRMITCNNQEDAIRKSESYLPNILTAFFVRS